VPPAGYAPPVPMPDNVEGSQFTVFFHACLEAHICGGRFPTTRYVSSRVTKSFTGRPVFLASNAAMIVYLPGCSLLPKPPPM